MGIYIKDMETPQSCFSCPMIGGEDGFVCHPKKKSLAKERGINISRPDWCPITDVPVTHGEWKHVKWVEDKEEQSGGWWISRCSNCSMPYNEETKYCPHCGAKMDNHS